MIKLQSKRESQKSVILQWLLGGQPLTQDIAKMHCLGCRRLSARILELREDGWNICNKSKLQPLVGDKRNALTVYRIDPTNPRV
jgi:hypothetical protein